MSVLPLPTSDDAGARLVAHFERLTQRFADAADRLRTGHDDEAVHDLRVAARRLESALQTWRSVLARRPRRRAVRLLRRIRRAAGPVREAEVHAAHLAELTCSLAPEAHLALIDEQTRLARRLERRRARLAAWLTEHRDARVARRVARACSGLTAPPADAGNRQVESRRRRALAALLAARPTLADTPLHDARIAVKRWRYAEESLAAARGTDAAAATGALRSVQAGLGRIHDHATLRDHLQRAAARADRRHESARAVALHALADRLETERVQEVLRFREVAHGLTPDSASAAGRDTL